MEALLQLLSTQSGFKLRGEACEGEGGYAHRNLTEKAIFKWVKIHLIFEFKEVQLRVEIQLITQVNEFFFLFTA